MEKNYYFRKFMAEAAEREANANAETVVETCPDSQTTNNGQPDQGVSFFTVIVDLLRK